jgi:hypothetical protein
LGEFELYTREFKKRMDLAKRTVLVAAREQLWHNGLNLEGHAKNLAPLDEGTLTSSGVTTRPEWRSNAWEVRVGFNESYAAKTHELMEPAMGAIMRRGPGTRAKSTATSSRFGVAGGKYIERPLMGMRRTYTKRIAEAVKGSLNKRRARAMRKIRARG